MKYIVIGLGNYGKVLAEELTVLGHEVIGADKNENHVDSIKDKIATALVLDATDSQAISVLPFSNVDAVIVAIGENVGASVRAIALLKQRKVKHIYARAIDLVHKAILEVFGVEKILTPEEDAAHILGELLNFGTKVETFRIDEEYMIAKFPVPVKFIDHLVSELELEKHFNLEIITVTRGKKEDNLLGMPVNRQTVITGEPGDIKIQEGDELVCYGKYKDFKSLWKEL